MSACVVLLLWVPTLFLALRRDLMMYQQNSYRPERYARWAKSTGESCTVARCCYLFACFLMCVGRVPFIVSAPLAAIVLVWNIVVMARRRYKKPLVFTPRARRIDAVAIILSAAAVATVWAAVSLRGACVAAMALLFVSQLVVLAADWLLRPVERHITRKYYSEAREILASVPCLKIIAVTGSYGKTSTKHYLYRILSEQYETLMTPGSYNTLLGVVRTIREQLKPYHEVFIVEMGAKQPGDIREICDLVEPEIGIITAVGEQHLETFKTIECVQQTKFELVEGTDDNGFVVLNNDFPYVANRPVKSPAPVRYAITSPEDADYTVRDIDYGRNGTNFTVVGPDGFELSLTTPLVGECNISNLLAAVIVALKIGVSPEKVRYAVAKMQQVEHRLEMRHTPGGLTIIDDAFNSNPHGSKMALDVLRGMTSGQRIVITPGMVELGDRQYDLNREFGAVLGRSADVAIVVARVNRDAILEGIGSTSMPESAVHAVDTFAEAQNLLRTIARPGDTVLYENDLPDTFK